MTTDRHARAELIENIHQPWRATLAECLHRWGTLSPGARSQSYLVLQEQGGRRHTLNATGIADLAARLAA